jgi:hypothetical protein
MSQTNGVYGSGVGSLPINNIDYISFLRMFMERNDIRTVVDFGCGDWQFSRYIDWETVTYTGFDVVRAVIERNQSLFARDNISFHTFSSDTEHSECRSIDLHGCISTPLESIHSDPFACIQGAVSISANHQ